jgi:alpha-D-ribose 1-methylphosphonate 5-triphosphate synthase subunit PhnG
VSTSGYSAQRRAELLASAERDRLVRVAERCLADGSEPTVLSGPETGTILLQVREPVEGVRFYLGEVLACRAEVKLGVGHGWALRLGDDRVATLAAAVCDAEADGGRAHSDAVLELCATTERDLALRDASEWRDIAPTIVRFEELD